MKRLFFVFVFALVSAVPAAALSPFPSPRLECVYHMTTDTLLEYWSTPANAPHLPSVLDDQIQHRSVTQYLQDRTAWGHCNDWSNGDESDLPFGFVQMIQFHYGFLRRQVQAPPS